MFTQQLLAVVAAHVPLWLGGTHMRKIALHMVTKRLRPPQTLSEDAEAEGCVGGSIPANVLWQPSAL